MATIHSEDIISDIIADIEKGIIDCSLIKAHNTVSDMILYNLEDCASLSKAVAEGVDAYDIHDMVNQLVPEQEYCEYFTYDKGLKTRLMTIDELKDMMIRSLPLIVKRTMAHPFHEGFSSLYKRYVTPMVELQLDIE